MTEKTPLYYTFGNHMHWVDMEWLWGYDALPESAEDMLRFIRESGAKGQVNFEGIGYEKLAVERPEVIQKLREAIAAGQVEVAGASYGQPYGLFHGGESNVRQQVYGARTVRRLLGAWPRTFWEEEFDFFPQLPQILRGVGFEYASLFFQWTWHTPHLPQETAPAIWWEGQDGSRLLTAPRSDLNLHQWPEEFAGLLNSPALRERSLPCLVQWLELMPSPDWMCRSELILPQLKALLAHPDFAVRFVTLPEYLELARPQAEPRRYTLDDVFHGVSLGKNGDLFRRLSRQAEQMLLASETLSALYGCFGRPYPAWDVYPTWELEEAWRELLSAQHHDNEECEGLCGHVGKRSYERSLHLVEDVLERTLRLLARRAPGGPKRMLVYNPLGWERRVVIHPPHSSQPVIIDGVPPFGYAVVQPEQMHPAHAARLVEKPHSIELERGLLRVVVDRKSGVIRQIYSADFPEGALSPEHPLADLSMVRNGKPETFPEISVAAENHPGDPRILIRRSGSGRDQAALTITVRLAPEMDAVDIAYNAITLPRPDTGAAAALQTSLSAHVQNLRLVHDHPYGMSEIHAEGHYVRKYPTGDWMTSPQVFETIENPFTALQLVDLTNDTRGLLYLHDGSQAYLRRGDTVVQILSLYDAWDEEYFVSNLHANVRVVPHGPMTNAQRWRLAQEFTRPAWTVAGETGGETSYGGPAHPIPTLFAAARCAAPNVALTALYREMESSGRETENYAGAGMAYPYILRLVELDGQPVDAQIRLPGRASAAFKTDLLGRIEAALPVAFQDGTSQVAVAMRPYEIATLYLDLEMGRKVFRDLDAERGVWATVHKGEAKSG